MTRSYWLATLALVQAFACAPSPAVRLGDSASGPDVLPGADPDASDSEPRPDLWVPADAPVSDAGAEGGDDAGDDEDVPDSARDDAGELTEDVDLPDGGDDGDAEVTNDDALTDVVIDLPCPAVGADGCGCSASTECDSGVCAGAPGRCAPLCDAQSLCGPGLACMIVDGGTLSACVDPLAQLCQPCHSHAECSPLGAVGQAGECVKFGSFGTFCSSPCGNGGSCPEGYECAETELLGGGTDYRCLKAGGCTCSELSMHFGRWAHCEVGAACLARRQCTADGLSPCEVVEGECDDGNQCTFDECQDGTCKSTFHAVSCQTDDDPCTDETCTPAGCVVSYPICDDGDPCTSDLCLGGPWGVCGHVSFSGPCDDGNVCTTGDTCATGVCVGTLAGACDDDTPCTTDACVGDSCVHDPVAGPCDVDGQPCTFDTCAAGACQPAMLTSCDDGDVCTADECGSSACIHTRLTGGPCDDGKFCTTQDSCTATGCAGSPRVCSGDAPCVSVECDPAADACVAAPLPDGAGCHDGDPCTVQDVCANGECVAGEPFVCTAAPGSCAPPSCVANGPYGFACRSPDAGGPCDDGDACTLGDACSQTGNCVPGPIMECVAREPCVDSQCVLGNCVEVLAPKGSPCADPCLSASTCSEEGECSGTWSCPQTTDGPQVTQIITLRDGRVIVREPFGRGLNLLSPELETIGRLPRVTWVNNEDADAEVLADGRTVLALLSSIDDSGKGPCRRQVRLAWPRRDGRRGPADPIAAFETPKPCDDRGRVRVLASAPSALLVVARTEAAYDRAWLVTAVEGAPAVTPVSVPSVLAAASELPRLATDLAALRIDTGAVTLWDVRGDTAPRTLLASAYPVSDVVLHAAPTGHIGLTYQQANQAGPERRVRLLAPDDSVSFDRSFTELGLGPIAARTAFLLPSGSGHHNFVYESARKTAAAVSGQVRLAVLDAVGTTPGSRLLNPLSPVPAIGAVTTTGRWLVVTQQEYSASVARGGPDGAVQLDAGVDVAALETGVLEAQVLGLAQLADEQVALLTRVNTGWPHTREVDLSPRNHRALGNPPAAVVALGNGTLALVSRGWAYPGVGAVLTRLDENGADKDYRLLHETQAGEQITFFQAVPLGGASLAASMVVSLGTAYDTRLACAPDGKPNGAVLLLATSPQSSAAPRLTGHLGGVAVAMRQGADRTRVLLADGGCAGVEREASFPVPGAGSPDIAALADGRLVTLESATLDTSSKGRCYFVRVLDTDLQEVEGPIPFATENTFGDARFVRETAGTLRIVQATDKSEGPIRIFHPDTAAVGGATTLWPGVGRQAIGHDGALLTAFTESHTSVRLVRHASACTGCAADEQCVGRVCVAIEAPGCVKNVAGTCGAWPSTVVDLPAGTVAVTCDPTVGVHCESGTLATRIGVGAFRVDRREVSVGSWQACMSAGACSNPGAEEGCTTNLGPDLPQNCVAPEAASAYCEWRGGRLPRYAELLYAARGKCRGADCTLTARSWPWGDALPTCAHATTSGCPWPTSGNAADGTTPEGVADLIGSLAEVVQTRSAGNTRIVPVDPGRGDMPDSNLSYGTFGGDWSTAAPTLASPLQPGAAASTTIGVRCVYDDH